MIECQNAAKQYPDFKLDITMEVPENTITALLGLNGSGKTTLFRLLNGLMKPDSGTVSLFDENAWTLSPAAKQKIGAVLSESGFLPSLDIKQIRSILASFYKNFDQNYFNSLVSRFRLPQSKPLSEFSNGMKARIQVIAALSHHPNLLLLDEPTAGLDIAARNEILDLLREYMEKPGHSILISSHIASDLENFCDDFYLISGGSIVLHDDIESLKNNYAILSVPENRIPDIDFREVVTRKKISSGEKVLIKDRQYYEDNYPQMIEEKGNIDDLLLMFEGDK